jgi:hypothetical protein
LAPNEWLRPRALYVDIETSAAVEITVVGFYAEGQMTQLVRGDSLTEASLREAFRQFDLLVTFNGSAFNLPCLRVQFPRLKLDQPHVDVCLAARRLGRAVANIHTRRCRSQHFHWAAAVSRGAGLCRGFHWGSKREWHHGPGCPAQGHGLRLSLAY